jgi:hypothetical protein
MRNVNATGRTYLAAPWAPTGQVVVAAATRYAVLVGTAATLRRLETKAADLVEELVGPPYAPKPSRAARAGALLLEHPDGFAHMDRGDSDLATFQSAAPDSFWADLQVGLTRSDNSWVTRTCAQSDRRAAGLAWYRRERAGERVAQLCATTS